MIAGIVFFCSVFGYMFKPLNLDEVDEEKPTPSISGHNNNNNNIKHNMSEHDFSNKSLLSPNNHQLIVRSHSFGQEITKNGGVNGNIPANGDDKKMALSLSQPLLNDKEVASSQSQRSLKSAGSGHLHRPDAFYTGSLHNLAKHRSAGSIRAASYGSLRRRSENREIDERPEVCGCIPCSKETHDTITQMMSFSLLKDPIFILFTVSNFLTR